MTRIIHFLPRRARRWLFVEERFDDRAYFAVSRCFLRDVDSNSLVEFEVAEGAAIAPYAAAVVSRGGWEFEDGRRAFFAYLRYAAMRRYGRFAWIRCEDGRPRVLRRATLEESENPAEFAADSAWEYPDGFLAERRAGTWMPAEVSGKESLYAH